MRSKSLILIVFAMALQLQADNAFIPKVGVNETPALKDGEIVVVVYPDGQPVGFRQGDGITPGGRWLYDARQTVRTSPINLIGDSDFTMSIGGAAYWTNGLISMFRPSADYANVSGIVTVSLVSTDLRIQSVRPIASGTDYAIATEIAANGKTATITGRMNNTPYPAGYAPTRECFIETVNVSVYSNPDLIGATQDLRGVTVLVKHPGSSAGTNNDSFLPITMGWYSNHVQSAVADWATHPAAGPIVQQAGMRIFDGMSSQQRFQWDYAPNGFLKLSHISDTSTPVMTVEAIDPWPWIVNSPSGNVAVLKWTTNGIAASSWLVQTSTNLVSGVWSNAVVLATNAAQDGYTSMTCSNVLLGKSCFWRVQAIGAIQQAAAVRFGAAVHAPSFHGSGADLSGVVHALPSVFTGGVVATSGNVLTNYGPIAMAATQSLMLAQGAWQTSSNMIFVTRIAGGTTTNGSIVFAPTNGTAAITILPNGSVGIKTAPDSSYGLRCAGAFHNIGSGQFTTSLYLGTTVSSGGGISPSGRGLSIVDYTGALTTNANLIVPGTLTVSNTAIAGGFTSVGTIAGGYIKSANNGTLSVPGVMVGSAAHGMYMASNELRFSASFTNVLSLSPEVVTIQTNLTVSGVSKIILPTSTNGLTSGVLWNDSGTVRVMP